MSMWLLLLHVNKETTFKAVLGLTEKLGRKYKDFALTSSPFPGTGSPLCSHNTITQSPSLIPWFALNVVHSGAFDKYIMTSTHHRIIVQDFFTGIKILFALPLHPWQPQPFHCL